MKTDNERSMIEPDEPPEHGAHDQPNQRGDEDVAPTSALQPADPRDDDLRHARDSSLHRRAQYQWPADAGGPAASQAQMAVETWIAQDGAMSAWSYRAQVRDTAQIVRDEVGGGEQLGAALPLLVYRHARASVAVDDPGRAIPLHAHAFARESFVDELAHSVSRNPVELRLQHLDPERDAGGREIIRMVTERAAWGAPLAVAAEPASPWLRGRGFAFDGDRTDEVAPIDAHTKAVDGAGDATRSELAIISGSNDAAVQHAAEAANSWSAWVVDLDVNRETGDVAVRRVVAGRASGEPGATQVSGIPSWQIEAAVARATGVQLLARAAHDETGRAGDANVAIAHELIPNSSAVSANQLSALPEPDMHDAQRIGQAAAPAAAAIANALFDATGVRFREPPFDAARIRRALADAAPATLLEAPAAQRRAPRWRRWLAAGGIGSVVGGLIGVACAILPGRASIAPIAPGTDASLWSAVTLERGRQIAAAGDCAVCHTAPGGHTNAGGLALETPFGTVYSTNLTPDPETGIGKWTYHAFARAMREGISRDGSHLYPAFPYTAFARMSEPDMMALYAYLMSQPPVKNAPPKTMLPFPLNHRPLVAGWNWLFHDNREFVPDPKRTELWNRGKYLVDGVGHCGACHTARNALGAEKGGFAYLTGGSAEGWDAPSLVDSHATPVPWTESALFDYLRTGFSAEHGVAAGPMAPVVAGLATLPESDVRAMAHYIASLSPPVDTAVAANAAVQHAAGADAVMTLGLENGRRTFEAACAVCHSPGAGVGHLGVRPLMGLNTSVSQARPDNLLRVLQRGIDQPATEGLGYMPGFGDAYDDRQMAELAGYIRARYAPDQPAWRDLEAASARVRREAH